MKNQDLKNAKSTPRPEWSFFCGTKWNKKAGTEGGLRRPKN